LKKHTSFRSEPLQCPRAGVFPALSLLTMFFLAWVAVTAAFARPGPAARVPARVLTATPDRVVFRVDLEPWTVMPSEALPGAARVDIPGFVRVGRQGEPMQPARKFMVGLPAEGTWRVSWRVLNSVSLGQIRVEPMPFREARRDGEMGVVPVERYAFEAEVYDSFRSPAPVAADEDAWIRRQRVLPVWVRPLSYDPASGDATLATSIEVTVTFGGTSRTDRRGAPVIESPEWEETFSRMLVNAGQARSWRVPSPFVDRSPSQTLQLLPTGTMAKLPVRTTGIHKVSAAALIAAGFPAGQPVADLHLFKRGYDEAALTGTVTDVAFTVAEDGAGTPGVFDGGDFVVFYAIRVREDATLEDPFELYTFYNVYWLGTNSGTVMSDRTMSPGYLSADTASAWFPVRRKFVEDRAFFEETKAPGKDYYFFNDGSEVTVNFPFEMDAVRPGSSVALTAALHGSVYNQIRSISTRLVNSKGNLVISPTVFVSNKTIVEYTADVPGGSFDAGANTFRYERSDIANQRVRVLLNWLHVSYDALYRAHGNALTFNTASLSGDTSVTVTGLSETDLWLFDVTDPLLPVNCVLDAGLFRDVGGSWALTFRDAIAARKEYVLVPESRMTELTAGDIVLDVPSAIIGNPAEAGVDVLVVAHRDFLATLTGDDAYDMHDWVRYRRAQGKRVLMVDVEDVYDEFNGGVTGTLGIDRFVRHFYETGNAGYLLLVGDGSEDHKRTYSDSNPDYIPSHCRTEWVGSGFNEDEVVTLDKEFVKMPNPAGLVDLYPDLVIGRFPVGSMSELQRMLFKIFMFEEPKADDLWRRRMILIADDGWGEAGTQSEWRGETGFETGQEQCAQIMENAHPGGFDVVRFYLSDHNNKYHTIPPPGMWFREPNPSMYGYRQLTRADATLKLLGELSEGATLVTIQAHMNRSLVAHEWLFVTLSTAPNGTKDHFRCNNRDKPFVIFGMGCHFSDYALHREAVRVTFNSPNGDSFAEQLLFQNREGAVSTYGSSGFEYLGQVNAYMKRFSEIWFYEAPYDTMVNQTDGRWVLGTMMFLVETEAITRLGQEDPVDRYHILGDPLLRIDAGPPMMEVTVNGEPVSSGDNVSVGTDTIAVVATVKDENVIEKFELFIDGVDMSNTLAVTPIGDESIPLSRSYEVRFDHELQLKAYDIVLRALQAPDTISGQYHMAAEFVLNVPSNMDVAVNGRVIVDGDKVPTQGDYQITLNFPVFVPSSEISVAIDDEEVMGLVFSHPSENDSTTWYVQFSRTLSDGEHVLAVTISGGEPQLWTLHVSSEAGLRNVVNYPNPFTSTTQFVFSTDVTIDQGTIDVFTVSGKRIAQLEIPPGARSPGQNAVFWDGRDSAGGEIANGVYLYVIRVNQSGQETTIRGKMARMR